MNIGSLHGPRFKKSNQLVLGLCSFCGKESQIVTYSATKKTAQGKPIWCEAHNLEILRQNTMVIHDKSEKQKKIVHGRNRVKGRRQGEEGRGRYIEIYRERVIER